MRKKDNGRDNDWYEFNKQLGIIGRRCISHIFVSSEFCYSRICGSFKKISKKKLLLAPKLVVEGPPGIPSV